MKSSLDKTEKNGSHAVANQDAVQPCDHETMFAFEDNRSEALAQRKCQDMANSSLQTKQQEIFQRMANSCPQSNQTIQLQAPVSRSAHTVASNVIQKTSIDPGNYFNQTRDDEDVNAGIENNELVGFGTEINNTNWHTKLEFDDLFTPGAKDGYQMNSEGSGVKGVIGPDHPFGSEPNSATAEENNHIAGDIRGNNPHGHVAAHIVNDQLGGPGIEKNLFAFPANANTLMETRVESKMKAAVEAGNYIYYRAVVHHPNTGPADYITMSWNKLDVTGDDIGGGQSNAKINADNTAGNTNEEMVELAEEAKTTTLMHPTSPTIVKGWPWGPFQMPDPKRIGEVGPFLDYTSFPAVGNLEAWKAYLSDASSSGTSLALFELNLLNRYTGNDKYTTIAKYIRNQKNINIRKRSGRGITNSMMANLEGDDNQRADALAKIISCSDRNKVIPELAKLLYDEAKETARNRV